MAKANVFIVESLSFDDEKNNRFEGKFLSKILHLGNKESIYYYVGYLNMLKEKGFGLLYPNDEIEIMGEKPKDLITPFKPHRSFKKQRIWR